MFATALALLSGAFHGKDRGTAFGVFGATTGVAVAVGPVLGGVLTSGLSWRWIFWVNIPICLLALAVSLTGWWSPATRTRAGRTGSASSASRSPSALLVYGLIRGGADGWGDDRVVVCFVASRRAAGGVRGQPAAAGEADVRPRRCCASRRSPAAWSPPFGVSASVFSLLTYLVIYVQNVLGYSAVETGVRFLFLSVTSFFAAAIAGRLTSHVPGQVADRARLPGRSALGLLLLHGIHRRLVVDPPDPRPDRRRHRHRHDQLAAGLDGGRRRTGPERAGMASGVNSTFRQVGIATGIAALGSIFSQQVANGIHGGAGRHAGRRPGRRGSPTAVTNGQINAVLAQAPPASAGRHRAGGHVELRRRAQPHHHDRRGDRAGRRRALPGPDPGQGLPGPPRLRAGGDQKAAEDKPGPKHGAEPAHVGEPGRPTPGEEPSGQQELSPTP